MPEQLSLKSELVIVRTDFGKPVSAIAITRSSESDYFVVHLFALDNKGSNSSEPGAQRKKAKVEPELARTIERVFEKKLHRFVMVAPTPERLKDHLETTWWVFLRGAGNLAITALIDQQTVHRIPEGFEFIHTLDGGLADLADSEPGKRREIVERLRDFSEEILASVSAKN